MDLIARHLNSTENMQTESNGLPNIAPSAAAFQISGNFLNTVSIIVGVHTPVKRVYHYYHIENVSTLFHLMTF